jgi:SAM-dependent methyltransferase
MNQSPGHWTKHALQWQWIGPPLRPAPEDIRLVEDGIRRWHSASGGAAPAALLLGVTPEIASLRWPAGTRLVAVDHSWAMIRGVWPGYSFGFPALCAEWHALPLPDESRDAVLGDGSFTALAGGGRYGAMVRSMRRVLRKGGTAILRFYLRPDVPEPPERIVEDLQEGRIGSFHVFKWRLVMAFQRSLADGVRLSDVWNYWRGAVTDPTQIAQRHGWAKEIVATMDAYRGSVGRYSFPTLAEARSAMGEAFEEIDCVFPSYELGERCPTLTFRPR